VVFVGVLGNNDNARSKRRIMVNMDEGDEGVRAHFQKNVV
jgi:hypothetical protein